MRNLYFRTLKRFGLFFSASCCPCPVRHVPGFRAVLLLAVGLSVTLSGAMPARAIEVIERRKPQFLTVPSYLVVPLPYSLPGIGEGWFLIGQAGNIAETNVDAWGVLATGDAEGRIFGLEDIHILSETLILELFSQNITKAQVNNYESRGMDSDPDDYTLLELTSVKTQAAQLTLSLFDRRLELFASTSTQYVEIPRIRDKDGNEILEIDYANDSESTAFGAQVDYTDDRQDPRKGVRALVQRSHSPNDDPDEAEFFVWNYAVTGYLPFGKLNTLVLHYFQSDAEVTREGNTDPDAIRTELGITCPGLGDPGYAECEETVTELVDLFVKMRKNGNSSSLGGENRLRSYPMGRFEGAHTLFYAIEFRWNLTEEATPFNYLFWKDVRTGVQVAFFAETGSVGETRSEVGDTYASTYGVGFRLVSGSGNVYRADFATGDEGFEYTMIFNYAF